MKRRAVSIAIGIDNAMWILVLEAVVALGMLVLVVWLTMGGSRRRDDEVERERSRSIPPEDRK